MVVNPTQKDILNKRGSNKTAPTVVGIGASAGGLESVSTLLTELPPDTGMSLVIVQHLDARQVSHLPTLLGRVTAMPVVEIFNGVPLQPNHVYVLPPGYDVLVEHGSLALRQREQRGGLGGQINAFFSSLARHSTASAVGVILSGTGTDGTRGLQAIKDNGGVTFAETSGSARFSGMPQSAVAAGAADFVLTPAGIARKLARLARHPKFEKAAAEIVERETPKPALPLERIFAILRDGKRINFSDYKHTTIQRRIARRMALRRVKTLGHYADLLEHDAKEVDDLFRDLLINVTGFFRDRPVFQALTKHVLPRLIAEKRKTGELRVWIPGCATGEEAYSIGICLHEVLGRMRAKMSAQIFGTDLSDAAINTARAGVFSAHAVREVPAAKLRRYFVRKNGGWQISRVIRDLCTFARQNLCEDPPFSRLDLISCRNVLIYLSPALQRRCIPLFYYALNPRGFLALGNSETIGGFANLFELVDKRNKIYRKKSMAPPDDAPLETLPRPGKPVSLPPAPPPLPAKSPAAPPLPAAAPDVQAAADQLLLTHFAPCGVVVDSQLQVWHFRGHTAPFLEHAPGVASLNVLKMVRRELAADLSAAIHQALKTGNGVRKEGMLLAEPRGRSDVQLEVIPFKVGRSPEQWLLIIFEMRAPAMPATLRGRARRSHAESSYAREVARLRAELASTKDSLQAIIEEQEAANEEIKSANEEIESSNEELQSTNEELETAKEELQSTNEELTTVNDELNNRNQEISRINNDLNNLLSSIHIAVVMVDNALIIRRITPLAGKLLNIIPGDIGRKLSDINPNLEIPELPNMIRSVLDQLTPVERNVRDREGKSYSLRVRPYRTRDNVIDGVVIALVDLNGPEAK
jgi:two-component system, chemotaxis family, CheB/CheR fusion protein